MIFQIKNRYDDSVLFEYDFGAEAAAWPYDLRLNFAVRRAVKNGASLSRAVLSGADLSGADLSSFKIPILPDIDAKILAAIEVDGNALDMGSWHVCNTTHCRAGGAIHLCGEAGYKLENIVGPAAAGALIYAVSRPGKPVPDFHATNEEALADIREGAEEK